MRNLKVKICCISSIKEAQIAIASGASFLGLVGNMPSGPGIISDELISEIAAFAPSHIETVLLTSETTVKNILSHHSRVNTSAIQIVDALTEGSHKQLKQKLPQVKIIQVIHVLNKESITAAIQISKEVDMLLLDSGNPNQKIKTLGGTGNIHNWEISKSIVEKVNIPVFLAGGLNSKNIRKAIKKVAPYGVDVCSGVRTNNELDKHKLKSFFEAL